MKKILSILLIGCLTFSLVACGGNKSNTAGSYKPYSPHEVFSAWADVFNENTKPEEKRGLSKNHPFYEMYEATGQSGISGKASDNALKYIKGHSSYFQEMLTTVEYEDVRNSFFELAMDVDLSVSSKDLKKDTTQYSDSLVLIYGTTSGLSEGILDNGQFTTGGYVSLQEGDNYDDYIEYYCIFNGIPPVSSGMDVVCIGVPLCLGQSTTGDDVICFAAAFIAPISGFGQIISESSGDIFDKYSSYFVQTFKVENNDEVDSNDSDYQDDAIIGDVIEPEAWIGDYWLDYESAISITEASAAKLKGIVYNYSGDDLTDFEAEIDQSHNSATGVLLDGTNTGIELAWVNDDFSGIFLSVSTNHGFDKQNYYKMLWDGFYKSETGSIIRISDFKPFESFYMDG